MSYSYTGQKKINEIIYDILLPTLEKQGWYLGKIMMNWEILAGEMLKNHVWPFRFSSQFQDRSKGILHVHVDHVGMQHIPFIKQPLIEKLNLYLGVTAIIDIKPKLVYVSKSVVADHGLQLKKKNKPFPAHCLDDITDPELKSALQHLGPMIASI